MASFWQNHLYLIISCSWHQTTKQPILFSPIFSTNFSQLEQLKKKTNFLLVQNRFFLGLGQMKSLFSFSSTQTEKNSWKKLGKTRFVVWWFDVTNKIENFDWFAINASSISIRMNALIEAKKANSRVFLQRQIWFVNYYVKS